MFSSFFRSDPRHVGEAACSLPMKGNRAKERAVLKNSLQECQLTKYFLNLSADVI